MSASQPRRPELALGVGVPWAGLSGLLCTSGPWVKGVSRTSTSPEDGRKEGEGLPAQNVLRQPLHPHRPGKTHPSRSRVGV